jgi:hypothetical protein
MKKTEQKSLKMLFNIVISRQSIYLPKQFFVKCLKIIRQQKNNSTTKQKMDLNDKIIVSLKMYYNTLKELMMFHKIIFDVKT